jgi:hypothetical protein
MVKGKKKSRFALYRKKIAAKENRKPFRCGPPPYLEEKEFEKWKDQIISETLLCHYLTKAEMAKMVYYFFI